jgi:hypothetical protein
MPPGAELTMIFTGLVGNDCATAVAVKPNIMLKAVTAGRQNPAMGWFNIYSS